MSRKDWDLMLIYHKTRPLSDRRTLRACARWSSFVFPRPLAQVRKAIPTGANIGDDNLIMMQNGATAELGIAAEKNYRISGHESFPCRYTWLPKAVRDLSADPMLFSDDERAMVALGVGKNMVRSIRFWAQAAGVAAPEKKGSGYSLTDFGRVLLGDRGLDPFLEDSSTLWLLHWNLSTDRENPLLAWDYLLNRWHEPELARSTALKVLHKEAARVDEGISMVTLEQHFDTFLHTYVPTRGRKGQVQEDNLDCPLVELDFLLKVGERGVGKREAIYSFRREEKPEISAELFAYCLDDFWRESHESTLPLREVAHGHGSPGQVFKLPEDDVRARLDLLSRQPDGFFAYTESAQFQQVRRRKDSNKATLLKAIYKVGKDA